MREETEGGLAWWLRRREAFGRRQTRRAVGGDAVGAAGLSPFPIQMGSRGEGERRG